MASKSLYVKRTKEKRRTFVSSYKTASGCVRCGERHPACLDLHHLDRATKNPRLTKVKATGRHYTGGSRWVDLSFANLEEEFKKCEVLCSNCHRKETAVAMGWHNAEIKETL